jgi:hypothetical protein
MNYSCYIGQLNVAQFIGPQFIGPNSDHMRRDAFNNAVFGGHLKIVKYLHYLGYLGESHIINIACANGYMNVALFLHSIGYVCTIDGFNLTVQNSHLDIIKYLKLTYNYRLTHLNNDTLKCIYRSSNKHVLKSMKSIYPDTQWRTFDQLYKNY